MTTYTMYFASVYGEGMYNTSDYNGATTQQGGNTGNTGSTGSAGNGATGTAGTVATQNNGSMLTNTGTMVGMTVGLSSAIIVAAILIKVFRRKPATATVAADTSQRHQR